VVRVFYYVMVVVVAVIFFGPLPAAIFDPSSPIKAGHCYRVDARDGIYGSLAGPKHVEIPCP
jgi:hypothetical protein